MIKVKTHDGHLRRSVREDLSLIFKSASYRNKARELTDRFQLVEIEMTQDVIEVDRVYPNLISLCSDIGGILKVLVFICISSGIVHNQIKFTQEIQNTIFLERSEEHDAASLYTYWHIFKYTYCCCSKKDDPRRKQYDRNTKIMAERMDMWMLSKQSEKTTFLAGALLAQYQVEILSKYKAENDNLIKETNYIPMEQAILQL